MSAQIEPIFSTAYAKTHQSVLRWTSIAIAGVLVVITLIWCTILWTKETFKKDMQSQMEREKKESGGVDTMGSNKMIYLMTLAFFFLVTVASSFLSWYVASLHVAGNNLIAFDVFQVVALIFLGLASYFFYKDTRARAVAVSLSGCSLVLEFVAFVILFTSYNYSGQDAVQTQTALYIPMLMATLATIAHYASASKQEVVG